MTKKSLIIWLLIVVFLWIMGFLYSKWNNVPTEAKKTEKEVFLEKWEEIGVYKFKEQEHLKNSQKERDLYLQAKDYKDKLLEELNGTGSFQ